MGFLGLNELHGGRTRPAKVKTQSDVFRMVWNVLVCRTLCCVALEINFFQNPLNLHAPIRACAVTLLILGPYLDTLPLLVRTEFNPLFGVQFTSHCLLEVCLSSSTRSLDLKFILVD